MGLLAAKLKKWTLSTDELEEVISLIKNRLLKVSAPERIYLFGSYSEGTIGATSDLDIAIVFSDVNKLKNERKIILNAHLFLDYSTDLLFFTLAEFNKKSAIGGVCYEITTKGVLIYDKGTKI